VVKSIWGQRILEGTWTKEKKRVQGWGSETEELRQGFRDDGKKRKLSSGAKKGDMSEAGGEWGAVKESSKGLNRKIPKEKKTDLTKVNVTAN